VKVIPIRGRGPGRATLSIVLSGDEPPSEFRIFASGKVETTKGTFTFDEAAAKSVMADYKAHGIDLMIDYDHASLASASLDPATAGKAAGWFNLELRMGELWAVNVRWTEPAAEALRAKEWRFMSPAFQTEEGRVCSLLNVAITNLPATRQLTPLMAAKRETTMASDTGLNPKLVSAALQAVASKDAKGGLGVLQEILAALLGGSSEEEAPPSSSSPPDSSVGKPPAGEPTAADKKPQPPAKDDKPEEVAASVSRLMRLTGAKSFVDAVGIADLYRTSHLELETERTKLAAERETLETAERRKGCAELVTLAGSAPATVWLDDKANAPKKYLAAMPIGDFRDYVADAIKASGKRPPAALKPPTPGPAGPTEGAVDKHGLTAREQQICKEAGTDPAVFAELKSRRESAKTSKG